MNPLMMILGQLAINTPPSPTVSFWYAFLLRAVSRPIPKANFHLARRSFDPTLDKNTGLYSTQAKHNLNTKKKKQRTRTQENPQWRERRRCEQEDEMSGNHAAATTTTANSLIPKPGKERVQCP